MGKGGRTVRRLQGRLVSVEQKDNKMADEISQDRKRKDEAVRATIMQKLIETGEKENLKEMLRTKLIECGWRDDLREHCKEVIRSKGLERITVDELVQMITPRGRDAVPDQIKGRPPRRTEHTKI